MNANGLTCVTLLLSVALVAEAPAQPAAQPGGLEVGAAALAADGSTLRFTVKNPTPSDLVAWVYRLTLHHQSGAKTEHDQLTDEVVTHALAKEKLGAFALAAAPLEFVVAGGQREFVRLLQPPSGFPPAIGPLVSVDVRFLAVVYANGKGFGESAELTRLSNGREAQAKEGLALLKALQSVAASDATDTANRLRQSGRALSPRSSELVNKIATGLERAANQEASDRALKDLVRIYELRYEALAQKITPVNVTNTPR